MAKSSSPNKRASKRKRSPAPQEKPTADPLTLALDPATGPRLSLGSPATGRLDYRLRGWLEAFRRRGKDPTLEIRVANLTAELVEKCPPWAPPELHLALDVERGARGVLDPETGVASLDLPLLVDYTELHDHASRLGTGTADSTPVARPLELTLATRLALPPGEGAFKGVGAGHLEPLPGAPEPKPIPGGIYVSGPVSEEFKCLSGCVSFFVAVKRTGTTTRPVFDLAKLATLVDGINKIFGCNRPEMGQCCIRFSIGVAAQDPKLPLAVKGDKKALDKALDDLRKRRRDKSCATIYLLEELAGSTQGIADFAYDVAMVQTKGLSMPRLISVVAHELGHILGLSLRDPDGGDPKGASTHSPRKTNLMHASEGDDGRLNRSQCVVARNRGLLRIAPDPAAVEREGSSIPCINQPRERGA